MTGLLHVVAATLRAGAAPEAIEAALEIAHGLLAAPGATAVLAGRSPEHLVAATWLESRDALEPFAASTPHMEFLLRGVAPVTREMWSASVETAATEPDEGTGLLWAFALPATRTVYDWQVRALLSDIDSLPGAASAGPTVEERDRFRAAGVVMLRAADEQALHRRLGEARSGWADGAGALEEALVPVSR